MKSNRPFAKPQEEMPRDFRNPPSDLDAEQAVLGSMLLDKKCIFSVQQVLSESDFYRESHRKLFRAMINLNERDTPIDAITLSDELKRTDDFENVGGASGITKLIEDSHTSANVDHYSEIVKEKSTARRCIQELSLKVQTLYDGSEPLKTMDEIFNFCSTDFGQASHDFECDLKELTTTVFEKIEKSWEGKRLPHIPSGYRDFDQTFRGWEVGALTVIQAPPKVGKSHMMINSADRTAQAGNKVGYIILDMRRETVMLRLISRRLGKSIFQIQSPETQFTEIANCIDEIRLLPLKIAGQENVGHDHKKIIRWMNFAVKNFGTKLFFVDSFTKLDVKPEKGQTDESFISGMINDFQTAAQKLDVAIVGTTDLNYDGKAKGSSRWGFGPDAVFKFALVENDTVLKVTSEYLRNGPPGEIFLDTHFAHSEVRDHFRRR